MFSDKANTGYFVEIITKAFEFSVAIIGIISIAGWVTGIDKLTSFGLGLKPMSIISASLFFLIGITSYRFTSDPYNRNNLKAGLFVACACIFIPAVLLLFSYFTRTSIFHVPMEKTIDSVPGSDISPLSAFSFIFSGLAYYILLLTHSNKNRNIILAFWISFFVLISHYILLLAYLGGQSILYSGKFIPPSLPSNIAFIFIGIVFSLSSQITKYKNLDILESAHTKSSFMLILVLIALSIGISTVAFFYFRNYEKRYQTEIKNQLSAITELKVSEIKQWRKERYGDASVFYNNTTFAKLFESFIKNNSNDKEKRPLIEWLSHVQASYDYDNLFLVNKNFSKILSIPGNSIPLDSALIKGASEAINSNKIVMIDFFKDTFEKSIRMGVAVPIKSNENPNILLGALIFRIDPNLYIYPMIKTWHNPNLLGETLIVKKDGDYVLFLNTLKYKNNKDLNFRISLNDDKVPAVKAVLGQKGIVDGIDYRGIPVLADIRDIPGSPWYIVSRLEKAGLYLPIRERLKETIILTFLILFGAGTILMRIWNRQFLNFARERTKAYKELESSEERFHSLVEEAPDAIFIQTNGLFAYVNPAAFGIFGASAAVHLIGKPVIERFHKSSRESVLQRIIKFNIDKNEIPAIEETIIKLDGTPVEVEVSAVPFVFNNENGSLVFLRDITWRKQAENSLRKSEERFRTTLDTMMEGCQIIGFDWHYIYVNDKAASHGRCKKEDLIGKSIKDMYPNIENTYMYKFLKICMEGRIPQKIENKFFYSDTEFAWFDLDIQPVPEGIFILSLDITQRKISEEQIRKLNRVYAVLSNINKTIVHVRDSQELFERACDIAVNEGQFAMSLILILNNFENEAYIAASKGADDEFINKCRLSIEKDSFEIGPTSIAINEKKHCIVNSIDTEENWLQWREDSLIRGYRSAASFPLVVMGRIRGAFTLYANEPKFFDEAELHLLDELAMDISYAMEFAEKENERILAESHIRHLNRFLKSIRNIHQLMIRENDINKLISFACQILVEHQSFAGAMIFLLDESSKPINFAKAFIVDSNLIISNEMSSDKLPPCFEKINKTSGIFLISERAGICDDCPILPEFESYSAMCVNLSHEKTSFGYLVVACDNRLCNDSEEKDMFTEMANDLSYALNAIMTQKAKEEVEESQKKLETQFFQAQKMEAVGRLASGVAHDFNNMLSVILGYSESTIMSLQPEDPLVQDIKEIIKAAKRSADLTGQLLAFSRKQVVEPKVLNLNEVIEKQLKMLTRLIGENIEVKLTTGDDLWPIHIDPTQVDQIIANLAVNARDAIDGIGTISIETTNKTLDAYYSQYIIGSKPGDYVLLTFSDTGIGMDDSIKDKIFEPFFTTKAEGKGTGLGLSTVFGIVNQNNGSINVYSEPGMGTTFRIYFPRYYGETEISQNKKNTGQQTGSETILIVEDENQILSLTTRLLERFGYTVLATGSADEALELARNYMDDIHLLLTDVIMPSMNGKELKEKIEKIKPSIKTIFMSGYTTDVISQQGMIDDNVNFLHKPFTMNALTEKVRATLDGK